MALVQRHYPKDDRLESSYLEGRIRPECSFLRPEILNSKLSSDYIEYPLTYGSFIYKSIDDNEKESFFEDRMDGILFEKCNMTMQHSSLSPLVVSDLYSPKNSPCISPLTVHSEAQDPSLVQNFVDPQLFLDKDLDKIAPVSRDMQLLSPPYSSMSYNKDFATTLASLDGEESNSDELGFIADRCSQMKDDFKTSIHQLSSQMFSPPISPQNNASIDIEGLSRDIEGFDKPSFDQFMVTVSFNDKVQDILTSSNETSNKLTTFGRFSTRKTLVSLETISSFIRGPEKSDGKFVCLYNGCLKRFGRKYNIQSHIQTHLSDRPYSCPVCHGRFVRHHDLKRHVKIHGDQKPYVCPCGKSFVRTDALKRHRIRGICKGSICERKI